MVPSAGLASGLPLSNLLRGVLSPDRVDRHRHFFKHALKLHLIVVKLDFVLDV